MLGIDWEATCGDCQASDRRRHTEYLTEVGSTLLPLSPVRQTRTLIQKSINLTRQVSIWRYVSSIKAATECTVSIDARNVQSPLTNAEIQRKRPDCPRQLVISTRIKPKRPSALYVT